MSQFVHTLSEIIILKLYVVDASLYWKRIMHQYYSFRVPACPMCSLCTSCTTNNKNNASSLRAQSSAKADPDHF